MNKLRALLFALGALFAASAAQAQFTPWSPVVPAGTAIDWSSAGAAGGLGLANGTLPSASWTQSGATLTPSGGNDTTQIAAALAACGTNHFVLLGSGTFSMTTAAGAPSNCVVRGSGANNTIVQCHATGNSCLFVGTNSGGSNDNPPCSSPCTSASIAITGGLTQGSTSITLASTSGMSVGGYLWITQLNDPSYTSNTAAANNGLAICNCDGFTYLGTRNQGQIVEITSVAGTTVGITSGGVSASTNPGLYYAYNKTPEAVYFTMATKNAGIEALQIFAENTGAQENFYLGNCAYCWVDGVESNFADGNWAEIDWTFHGQITNSYMSNAFGHGSGTNDSTIEVRTYSSGNLIQNNILERGHIGGVMFEWGAAGNVAAYNFTQGQFDSGATGGSNFASGATLPCTSTAPCSNLSAFNSHGLQPSFNLIEGNKGNQFQPDNVWGSSMDFNLFRNWWTGTVQVCGNGLANGLGRGTVSCAGTSGAFAFQIAHAYEIESFSEFNNFIGDVAGSTQQQALKSTQNGSTLGQLFQVTGQCGTGVPTPCGTSSRTFGSNAVAFAFGYFSVSDSGGTTNDTSIAFTSARVHGVYTNMNTTTTWTAGVTHTLPASFYLASKPGWFGIQPFPLNGPDITGGSGIGGFANKTPAEVCYNSIGGTDGSGSPISGFNAATCYAGGTPTVATPTFSPGAGSYGSSQSVTISDSTSGATLCYTTDGSTPTANGAGTCTHGTTYSTAVTVASSLTLQAVGSLSGDSDSSVGSAAYTITPTTAGTPSCSPVGGTYNATQSVSCSVTGGAPVMCYTTNGTPPVTNGSSGCTTGTLYSGAISISASATLKVIAGGTAFLDGTVNSQIYTLTVATPTFNPVGGTYLGAQSVTISTVTSGATITYTTDGSTPVPGSHGTVYAFPVLVATSLTLKAVGSLSGFNNSATGSTGYTINPPLIAPANPAVSMQ
jgi:hypothetical protein